MTGAVVPAGNFTTLPVQRVGNRSHDIQDVSWRRPVSVPVAEQLGCVSSFDIVHRDPQLAVVIPAIMDPDDVRMPQRRRQFSFPVEPLPIFGSLETAIGRILSGSRRGSRGCSAR